MGQKEDRRNSRRISLEPPVAAQLSHFAVSLVDLSTTGARIQHDAALPFHPGKRFVLEFTCDGDRFVLPCNVARSRLDINSSAHRKVYTSGVRFVEVSEETSERLWGLIGLLAIDVLAHQSEESETYQFTILSN